MPCNFAPEDHSCIKQRMARIPLRLHALRLSLMGLPYGKTALFQPKFGEALGCLLDTLAPDMFLCMLLVT